MSQTVRVRFTRPYTVKDADRTHYPAESEHEFSPASAQHFISRGAAEVVQAGGSKRSGKPKETPEGGGDEGSSGSGTKPKPKPKQSGSRKKKDDDKPTGESSEGAGDSGTES